MHSTWVRLPDHADRWQLNQLIGHGGDGSVNYMLRDGERIAELHVSADTAWLHEYTGHFYDDAQPFLRHGDNVTLVESAELVGLAGADAAAAWAALERWVQR